MRPTVKLQHEELKQIELQHITNMKKYILIHAFILITIGLSLMASSAAGQEKNEFAVPLSDPAKRGKIRAVINNGSITIKGTARKDVLVKYSADEDDDDDREDTKDGLRRIGGGGMDLEVTENSNTRDREFWDHGMIG